ncbi:hypothetical protein LTR53_013304 [Teratosphaeriaceae sp. CCFEE 6253]|nr:hypothetical protein LTR53_013304 [Teratosphaeriaceae sp. CCFEE 6253]
MKPALLSLAFAAVSLASHVTFTNTRRLLFDVDGNQIDAYGSKINCEPLLPNWNTKPAAYLADFNGTYYLYGNSFSTTGVAFGIKSYSSVDLEHCSTYVLWANAGSSGYQVATSASPSGPFTFLNNTASIDPQFDGLQPADFTVEIINNKGYLVFSALNFRDPRAGSIWPPIFQTLHISELTDDYLNTTQVSYPVTSNATDLIDQEAESPDLFMRDGVYYVSASNTCGYCNGSIGLLYRSDSIQGPWIRQIIAGYSCEGQVEGVLPLRNPDTAEVSYVWHSTSVPGGPRIGFGGHIFQPLTFCADGSAEDLDCSVNASLNVDFEPGAGAVAKGLTTEAGQSTPPDVVYTPICDSDQFDLFQTWTATQSGKLTSVSVNIARSVQTVPLALTFFKFDSYDDLVAPEYKWTALGTVVYNASSLSYVFNTTSVPVTSNATISTGDLLGLAISGSDFAPYCHLEYETASNSSFKLYQRGSGQNSWRGLQGKTSIVYERLGRSVKMFVSYA